jgi:hypothetical protein
MYVCMYVSLLHRDKAASMLARCTENASFFELKKIIIRHFNGFQIYSRFEQLNISRSHSRSRSDSHAHAQTLTLMLRLSRSDSHAHAEAVTLTRWFDPSNHRTAARFDTVGFQVCQIFIISLLLIRATEDITVTLTSSLFIQPLNLVWQCTKSIKSGVQKNLRL